MITVPIKQGDISYAPDLSGDYILTVRVSSEYQHSANALLELLRRSGDLEISISKASRKHSAQSMKKLWASIHDLSALIGVPTEEVYREVIRRYGTYDIRSVPNSEVSVKIAEWELGGRGNFAEILSVGKDTTEVRFYHGCSTYGQEDMSRLIDGVIDEIKGVQE